jgi:hypothetical protein
VPGLALAALVFLTLREPPRGLSDGLAASRGVRGRGGRGPGALATVLFTVATRTVMRDFERAEQA